MVWLLQIQRDAHADNIRRYSRLLLTRLSPTEKQYVERRLREEQQAYLALMQQSDGEAARATEADRSQP